MSNLNFHSLLVDGLLSFILFAGSVNLPVKQIKKTIPEISVLAISATLLSVVIVAELTYLFVQHFEITYINHIACYLFGAIISPTDPVAVLGMLKRLHAPSSLTSKIAGESLFNDGIGIVVFTIIVGTLNTGTEPTFSKFVGAFITQAFGGLIYGYLLSKGIISILEWEGRKSHSLSIILSLTTLFVTTGGYTVANLIGISGPIAMVISGIVFSEWLESTSQDFDSKPFLIFWELIDDIFNMLIYTLIGLELITINYSEYWYVFMIVSLFIVLLARYVSVFVPLQIMSFWRDISHNHMNVVAWGGLRGGLALALALSIPESPARDMILIMTYTIVCFSTIVQSITIKYFLPKESSV